MTKHFIKEIGIYDEQTRALTVATAALQAAILAGDTVAEAAAQTAIDDAKTALTGAVSATPRCIVDNAEFDVVDGYELFTISGRIQIAAGTGDETRVEGSAIVAVCAGHLTQWNSLWSDYLYGSAE